MSEIEFKFGIPGDSLPAVRGALRALGARSSAIESHYWDSADRRLAKAGLSLRLRKSGGRWEQTLKAAGASPLERLEETVSRPGRWDPGGPAPELWMFAGAEAGRLADVALARRHKHVAPLERVHSSVIGRRAARIDVGGADIEIALDQGTIVAGDRSLPVCEFEAELKGGDLAGLIAFAHASIDAHGMWLSTIAKSQRGERLASSTDEAIAAKARPARMRSSASGEEIFRAVVRSCLEHVLANASLLAEGETDDDVVHQLRVGIRRIRTAWRELGEWRGALTERWEAPAADVFRQLGDYRDRKTVAASMQRQLAAAGSPEPVLQSAGATHSDLASLVRARPFQHALVDLLAFVSDADGEGRVDDSAPGRPREKRPEGTIGKHLDKLHARLKRDARRFEQLADPGRHAVRRRLKRLRYLTELVAPLYRGGRVGRFLGDLEPAQDELGHYMDLVVAARLAGDVIAAGEARAWFNVGWLKAQLPRAVERCSKALERVADATPYWHGASAWR